MDKKRVLSGIRASGRLHLGNYLGMVKGMLELSKNSKYEVFFMVADLHATTTPFDPKKLKENIYSVVLDYLAVGLDPERASVFVQSHVPAHTELATLFSTVISVARMSHLPTYKEKVKQYPKNVTMALLNYPVLMAADILAYKTSELPVGDDQLPHLEVAREVAKKMNDLYGLDFPQPKQLKTEGHYVPSLTGEGKMSKSVEGSYISLTDDLETIKKRLAKVPTDSGKGVVVPDSRIVEKINTNLSKEMIERLKTKEAFPVYQDKEAGEYSFGVKALLTLVELFQGKEKRAEYEKAYQGKGIKYSELKDELAEAIYEELKPIQERRERFEKDPSYVKRVIEQGAERARKVANQTVKEVKEKMGLL